MDWSQLMQPARLALVAFMMIAAAAASPAYSQTHHLDMSAADKAPATFKVGEITVTQPWTRATPGGARIAGGYLTLENAGAGFDRLIGATTDRAGRVEFHEMSMSDGVMKMRPLPDGIAIKPGESVALKPGGFHIMFMDLKQPLRQGDVMKATLQFEKAGRLDVDFAVNAVGATTAPPPAR